MVFPIRTPRVNNNDDVVRLSAVFSRPGAKVRAGEMVAEVETDKATFSVEAERSGYFLACPHAVGETITVGSVLVWMGESADDTAPGHSGTAVQGKSAEPTLKAALLLREHGLTSEQIPASGDRLTAVEVEAWIAARWPDKGAAHDGPAERKTLRPVLPLPAVAHGAEDLSMMERGMLRTVAWHRDEAVPGYVEIAYDPTAWEVYGAAFQKTYKLLLNPMLAL